MRTTTSSNHRHGDDASLWEEREEIQEVHSILEEVHSILGLHISGVPRLKHSGLKPRMFFNLPRMLILKKRKKIWHTSG